MEHYQSTPIPYGFLNVPELFKLCPKSLVVGVPCKATAINVSSRAQTVLGDERTR